MTDECEHDSGYKVRFHEPHQYVSIECIECGYEITYTYHGKEKEQ